MIGIARRRGPATPSADLGGTVARYVQLRVHGVSGTTPEELLGVEAVDPPVAGDDLVGFVRPVRDTGDGEGGDLEGMSWGRLTSGSVIQATWLLLLPFAVLNLGYWARSWNREGRLAGAYRGLVRAIGLSLTATIVFTAATITVDQLGWQCLIRDRDDCVQVNAWLGWAQNLSIGLVLVMAALVPVALVALLALLSHRTSLRYEAFPGDVDEGDGVSDPHLFSRRMWRGELMVTRLRGLHIATGIAATAAVAAAAGALLGEGIARIVAIIALVLAGIVVVVCLASGSAKVWVRWTDDSTSPQSGPVLIVVSLLALTAAMISAGSVSGAGIEDQVHLPGVIMIGHVLIVGQILLLTALLVVVALGRRYLGQQGIDGAPHEVKPAAVALRGFAGWFITALAVILGFAYSAAAVSRTPDLWSGTYEAGPCEACRVGDVSLQIVPAFDIAAAFTGIFVVVAVLLLLPALAVWALQRRSALVEDVVRDYPDARGIVASDERVQRAVRPRVLEGFVALDRFFGWFVTACATGVLAGLYAGVIAVTDWLAPGHQISWPLTDDSDLPAFLQSAGNFLQSLGTWVVAGFAVGLIALGALAWRNDRARRLVGILWDILSFWPRAGHPLAPPSYAERAVPQLTCRVQYLAGADSERPGAVVLAGHSQGSVLAIAAFAQLPQCRGEARVDRVALLTYGSPLTRLYARVFPRLFSAEVVGDPARFFVLEEGRRRWTNLWRPTDPIGSSLEPILPPVTDPSTASGDVRLRDPSRLTMIPERSAYAPVRGHSDYPADKDFGRAVRYLASLITTP